LHFWLESKHLGIVEAQVGQFLDLGRHSMADTLKMALIFLDSTFPGFIRTIRDFVIR